MMQNPGKLVKALAAMQQNMAKIQKDMEATEFTGKSANGLIEIVVSGKGETKSAKMNPALRDEDADTIAALFVVAFNDAYKQKEAKAAAQLKGVGAGLLPVGISLPGM